MCRMMIHRYSVRQVHYYCADSRRKDVNMFHRNTQLGGCIHQERVQQMTAQLATLCRASSLSRSFPCFLTRLSVFYYLSHSLSPESRWHTAAAFSLPLFRLVMSDETIAAPLMWHTLAIICLHQLIELLWPVWRNIQWDDISPISSIDVAGPHADWWACANAE